jgi:hypothetical protein
VTDNPSDSGTGPAGLPTQPQPPADSYAPPGWSLPPPTGWTAPSASPGSDPSGGFGFTPPAYSWAPRPSAPPGSAGRPLKIVAAIAATVLVGAAAGVAVAFATRSPQSTPSGASSTPGATSPANSRASALYHDALNATRTAAGFHYVSQSSGPEPQTIVGDAGPSGGRQDITFDSNYGTEQFTLLLVGSTVFFEGNTPAIEDQLGVATANAAALQGKWVTVSQGDGPYTVLQPGITVSDQAQEIQFLPASTANVTTQDGTSAYRIAGSVASQQGVAATAHLDITTSTHQPLAYVTAETSNGVSITSTTTFTNWGTAPTVAAPSGTVAWSTLGATAPPGGYGSGGEGGGSATPTPTPGTI